MSWELIPFEKNFAKADSNDKREEAKKRLISLIVGIVVIAVASVVGVAVVIVAASVVGITVVFPAVPVVGIVVASSHHNRSSQQYQ